MTIKITPTEAIVLNNIANDSNTANKDGIEIQGTPTPLFIEPIADYVTTVPPGSDTETLVKNAIKSMFASYIRHTGPFAYASSNSTPDFTINTATSILTVNLPTLEVGRTVQVQVNGTAYASTTNIRMDYWLILNGGLPQPVYKLLFNNANTHMAFGASWIVNLPAGANSLAVRTMPIGAGNIIMDAGDFVSLTLLG